MLDLLKFHPYSDFLQTTISEYYPKTISVLSNPQKSSDPLLKSLNITHLNLLKFSNLPSTFTNLNYDPT